MQVGDIVKKVDTYWYGKFGESRDDIGRLYVISKVSGEYEIMDLQTGDASAWWHDDQLKYMGRARDDIFEILDKIKKKREERYTGKEYIKKNYPMISFKLWLKLFDEIGYVSSFKYNGEYPLIAECTLITDVFALTPLFNKMFIDRDVHAAVDMVDDIFRVEYRQKYKQSVKAFYERWFGDDG